MIDMFRVHGHIPKLCLSVASRDRPQSTEPDMQARALELPVVGWLYDSSGAGRSLYISKLSGPWRRVLGHQLDQIP